ncbi:PREDICTED: 37S ribosomal protein S9, mitochondrial [Ipomoea nil]|uniref:37S ribosomal protein S9, mitochondrial n=1 Tax=Ipomoea nil TaxID=35883 RepID=UPI0009009415|nr:PREDICTED: 37S ribosomal protein S9, mitochondrial [Ipomoea nil]
MLSRFISRSSSHLRLLTQISSNTRFPDPKTLLPRSPISPPTPVFVPRTFQFFSTNNNGESPPSGPSDFWKLSSETQSVFSEDIEGAETTPPDDTPSLRDWEGEGDALPEKASGMAAGGGGGKDHEWPTAAGYEAWSSLVDEGGERVFDIGEEEEEEQQEIVSFNAEEEERLKKEKMEEEKRLELEEKALTPILKGPNRAFGDLIAASGITDDMLDSLMALKDFEGIKGLPPLHEIEDMRYQRSTMKSSRAEIERQKQEEAAKARVRQVDEKGRSYGTGRRKCSIARVWIEPGDGKFVVNDKEFDVYFPMLDHRANLLRPFSETKTLGMWDVKCTVKGGGVSGQVGAIQLGVSRALQKWDPELRPPLRKGGFLTRDSRVVERKKPGRAKARKSFQWVKR